MTVYVTPDGNRHMRAFHGAEKISFPKIKFSNKNIILIDGYGLAEPNRKIHEAVLMKAHKKGSYTILMASDPSCVKKDRVVFRRLLKGPVRLIIMNLEEACLLVNGDVSLESLRQSIRYIQGVHKNAVITLGEKGALFIDQHQIIHCPSRSVKVKDTTGAGDAFAGAFIFGLTQNKSIKECLQLGNYMASEIVTKLGARLESNFQYKTPKHQMLKHQVFHTNTKFLTFAQTQSNFLNQQIS